MKRTDPSTETTRSQGRPRDVETTAAILRATWELGEEAGFDGLTVEGVAARTGVGKTTIYRRWPNIWAIVMDAFLAEVTRLAPIETEGTSAREALTVSMRRLVRAYRGRLGKIVRPLVGRAQVEPALLDAVRTRWIEPRRRVAYDVLRRGIASGELRPDLDLDVVLDALFGPIYHRLLLPYEGATLSETYIDNLAQTVFGGLEQRQKQTP